MLKFVGWVPQLNSSPRPVTLSRRERSLLCCARFGWFEIGRVANPKFRRLKQGKDNLSHKPFCEQRNVPEELHLSVSVPLPAHHEGGRPHDRAGCPGHAEPATESAADARAGAGDGGPRPRGRGRPRVTLGAHHDCLLLSRGVDELTLDLTLTLEDGREGGAVRLGALEEGHRGPGVLAGDSRFRRDSGKAGRMVKSRA